MDEPTNLSASVIILLLRSLACQVKSGTYCGRSGSYHSHAGLWVLSESGVLEGLPCLACSGLVLEAPPGKPNRFNHVTLVKLPGAQPDGGLYPSPA